MNTMNEYNMQATGNPYEVEIKDAKEMTTPELKKHICTVAAVKVCENCVTQCEYGKEWARRKDGRFNHTIASVHKNGVTMDVVQLRENSNVRLLQVGIDGYWDGKMFDVAYFTSPATAEKFACYLAQMLSDGVDRFPLDDARECDGGECMAK